MATGRAILDLDPSDAAVQLAADRSPEWLDAFSAALTRQRAAGGLRMVLDVWGLTQSEAARVIGVSRQAVGKWLAEGIPGSRVADIGDLIVATELLIHYIKRDRIPAVVRRPSAALDGRSLLDLLAGDRVGDVLVACRAMFDFAAIQG